MVKVWSRYVPRLSPPANRLCFCRGGCCDTDGAGCGGASRQSCTVVLGHAFDPFRIFSEEEGKGGRGGNIRDSALEADGDFGVWVPSYDGFDVLERPGLGVKGQPGLKELTIR